MARWLLWRGIIPCCKQFRKNSSEGSKTVFWAAQWLRRQTIQRVEHRRKHIKYCDSLLLCYLGYNNNRFLSQRLTFSSPSQHFLGIPSFLLPLARKLPFIRRPNYCIFVWLQLICWLVLLASLSMLLTGYPWFTNTGVFVDTQGMESRYPAMHCVGCLCWRWRP